MAQKNPIKVLFVCIHNSARSQMAEELLRLLGGDRFDVQSAGVEPGKLNPIVVDVLKELKIDISHKKTQSVHGLWEKNEKFDYVITVCDETSAEKCPFSPGLKKQMHWGFPDPSQFKGSYEQKLEKIRLIRDQISQKIEEWIPILD